MLNSFEVQHIWEWMWHQDIPEYSGMFPFAPTNEHCGTNHINQWFWYSQLFSYYNKHYDVAEYFKIFSFIPSLLTSSISKILLALESAVSLKGKITTTTKMRKGNDTHTWQTLQVKIMMDCKIVHNVIVIWWDPYHPNNLM